LLKKAFAIIAVPLIFSLLFALFSMNNNFAVINVVYASPADSYGNDILYIEVWEGSTLKANFTSSGGSVRVNASKTITFNVTIKFSTSLASSQDEAIQYTRVYLNITGIVTNAELTNVACWVSGPYYYLVERYAVNPGTLSGGQTYACSVLYQGYY
jgi:hypothetical protein